MVNILGITPKGISNSNQEVLRGDFSSGLGCGQMLFLQLDRWIRPRGKEREGGKLDLPYCHSRCSPHAPCQEHKIQVLACQGERKDLRLCAGRADWSLG